MPFNIRYIVIIVALLAGVFAFFVFQSNQETDTASQFDASGETSEAHSADLDSSGQVGDTAGLSALEKPNPLGEIVIGNAEAPVTMVEYASLTCGHCGAFHNQVLPLLKAEYVDTGKLKILFRSFPFDGLATAGAMLAHCVAPVQQSKFLMILFERQSIWLASQQPLDELLKISRQAGLSEADFRICLKDESILAGIRAVQKDAHEELKVQSTPTFFINGARLEGNQDISVFREAINAQLPAELR